MATFIETLPTFTNEYDQECVAMSPGSKMGDEYYDGYFRTEWFKNVFPAIANATLPLAQDHYDSLKAIGDFWKINAIHWRKNGLVEVDKIPADKLIEEEEAFLQEMYPPVEEQPTEEA